MIDSHAPPSGIRRDVVHAVWNRLAEVRVREVLHVHLVRFALDLPFPTAVAVPADQFLLLSVHRNHRLSLALERLHASAQVPELRVPVGMLPPFERLAVRLQAVAQLVQQAVHRALADLAPLAAQLPGQARPRCCTSSAAAPSDPPA